VKTVSLDVHADASQVAVVSEEGEVQFETKVKTERDALRTIVAGVPGPKRVVFEEGPLSGSLHDWLADLCEETISCDPSRNALIARSEDANDERDARRLATLARAGALHPVYVPDEPYRTLRSLVVADHRLQRLIAALKNRIGGLCRRHGAGSRQAVWRRAGRGKALSAMPNGAVRWQLESLYRQLDAMRRERVAMHRVIQRWTRPLRIVRRLQTIPGVGPITARTLVAWIADPRRFENRRALSGYGGLGLGQGWTNWKPVGRARASKPDGNATRRRATWRARS